MNDEDKKIARLMAELISSLPGFNPLEVPKDQGGAAERFALASMYKDKAYREYLSRSIRLNISRFQNVEDLRGMFIQQGRVEILKELLSLSKQMYTEALKIDKTFKE